MASKAIWPSVLWAALILIVCLIPGSNLPEWNWVALFDLDKVIHAFMFFVQAVLLARLFLARQSPERWLFWAITISICFGLATELLQGLQALGRRTDPNDMIANSVGALLAGWWSSKRQRMGRSIIPYFSA